MTITVVTPPAPAISLAEAKEHLRVDHTDDDVLIAGLVDTAAAHISALYDRAIGKQTLLWTVPEDPCRSSTRLALPRPPFRSLVSVRYTNSAGVISIYDTTLITPFQALTDARTLLRFAEPTSASNVSSVEFIAGDDDVPWDLMHAIKLLVARLYEHRGEMVASTLSEDRALSNLLSPFRPMVA